MEAVVTFLGKWADGIEKTLRPIARVGIYISMAALCLTVLFMVGDVISRSLFKAGFPGTKDVEPVSYTHLRAHET